MKTMIKKGTQCKFCNRKEGEHQKVILTKDSDDNFVCPWCLASHPDLTLAQTKHELDGANESLKNNLWTLRKAQGVILKQRELLNTRNRQLKEWQDLADLLNKLILMFIDGDNERATRLYKESIETKNKNDIN